MFPNETIAKLINNTVSIITDELGLKAYEGHELADKLGKTNFNEFWFPGSTGGSFKVFLNERGVPFVLDQHNSSRAKVNVERTNKRLAELFA